MAKPDKTTDAQHDESYDRDAEVRALLERRTRKAPTLAEKCASALLTICRPDANGNLIPVIDPERAKTMDARSILSVFEYDHVVLHALGGSNHPSNLVPRPKAEHREKSKGDTSIVAKVRRVAPEHEANRRKMLAKSGQGEAEAPSEKPKAKIQSRGFAGSRNFKGEVTWKK